MTVPSLALEPVVSWPREAAPGGRYLVTVDLRTGGADAGWPYQDAEEYAVGIMVSGRTGLVVESLDQTNVVLHRFGGTYGPARFVVTVGSVVAEGTGTSLWLTLLSSGGVPFHTVALPMTVTRHAPKGPPAPVPVSLQPQERGEPVSAGADIRSLAALPLSGRPVLTSGDKAGAVRLWTPGEVLSLPLFTGNGPAHVAPVTVAGRVMLAATSGDAAVLIDPVSRRVVLRRSVDSQRGTEITALHVIRAHGREQVVVGTQEGWIYVLDPADGLATTFWVSIYDGPVLAFCDVEIDGTAVLVAGGKDGPLKLLDPVLPGRFGSELVGHLGPINALAALPAPDGRPWILSASEDSTVRVWDPATGRVAHGFEVDAGDPVDTVTALPGPARCAVWGTRAGALWWWDAESGVSQVDRRNSGAVTALAAYTRRDQPALAVARRTGVLEVIEPPSMSATAAVVSQTPVRFPAEQEFVAHVFAPLTGPSADAAFRQIRSLWRRCGDELGMTEPIVNTDLRVDLPDTTPSVGADRVWSGRQDAAVNYQAIVRQEHDVLNLSLVFAVPVAATGRIRVGAAAPPGWAEFARWWRQLTAEGTEALLGVALIFQAKVPDRIDREDAGSDVRAALPSAGDDGAGWWRTSRRIGDHLRLWEATAGGDQPGRRLVVLAVPGRDIELSTLTWSAGDVTLPPLGRYLLHAAKLRYQARVRGDGGQLADLRGRMEAALDQMTGYLTGLPADRSDRLDALLADRAVLAGALSELRTMRRTVDIAVGNMRGAIGELLPKDAALAGWLSQQLADDEEFLDATWQRTERMVGGATVQALELPVPVMVEAGPGLRTPASGRVEQRMGFGVDVVQYSSRSTPQQNDLQRRLGALFALVMDDLGVRPENTDRQDTGDGMMVVLPPNVEFHRALPRLLHGWRDRLAADNAIYRDRLRMRLSVSAGPFAAAAIGFSGNTIIEIGRLLDSQVLREAAAEHPDADLVALVSDRLYEDVVGADWPGLSAGEFESRMVEVKAYRKPVWLWTG